MWNSILYGVKALMELFYGGGDDAEPITDQEAKSFAVAMGLGVVATVVIWWLLGWGG